MPVVIPAAASLAILGTKLDVQVMLLSSTGLGVAALSVT